MVGEKVILRFITKEDTDLVVRWRNNPRVRCKFVFQEPFTAEIHNHWLETRVKTGEVVQFIILSKGDEKEIGSVYLKDIDYTQKIAEGGIFIGEDSVLGKGYGTEAMQLLVKYAFEKLKLNQVFVRVFVENKASIAICEKAGFSLQNKKEVVCIDGIEKELLFMERVKRDYR